MAWHDFKKITLVIKIVFVVLMLSVFLGLVFIVFRAKAQDNQKYLIKINGTVITAEAAVSPWRQYLGLSNRESICSNCGMLFVFLFPEEQKFVMRNMKFPLDIVFINDKQIINIEQNLPPEGAKTVNIYSSQAPADMVLELPGNFCQQNGISAGNQITIEAN